MDEEFINEIDQYVNEDAESAILKFEDMTGTPHDVVYVDDITYRDDEDGVVAVIAFVYVNEHGSNPYDDYATEIEVKYWAEGDDIMSSEDPETIAQYLVEDFTAEGAINASTKVNSSKLKPIMAAEGDDEVNRPTPDFGDDMFAEDVVDDDMEDQLDDIADSVEDLQDAVDDVEEDEPSIEVNNNIENHYIAECDGCQGIFISSVVKSDQDLESIQGTCPICNKETTQYLKWVVSPIE